MENRNTNNCCVDGCRNKQKDSKLSFFTLPKDSERRNEWLKEIGRPDLLKKTNIKIGSYKVCSIHFDTSVMTEVLVRKLLPNAVPTMFLPNQPESEPNSSNCHSSDISTQTDDLNVETLSVVNIKDEFTIETETETEINKESQETESLSSDTPRKRKLSIELEAFENKRKLDQNELDLDKIKKETD